MTSSRYAPRFAGLLALLLLLPLCASADTAGIIADLIAPAKLATLRSRGANPRVQKCVYWLVAAKHDDQNPSAILDDALLRAGYTNAAAARLTKATLLRNVNLADQHGCLDKPGMSEMRQGKAPTVTRGEHKGEELSVDHIVPRTVAPELDNVIANLELMPQRVNSSKNSNIGSHELAKARELHRAGLLSAEGLRQVEAAASTPR